MAVVTEWAICCAEAFAVSSGDQLRMSNGSEVLPLPGTFKVSLSQVARRRFKPALKKSSVGAVRDGASASCI